MNYTQTEIDINNITVITAGIIAKEGLWQKPNEAENVKRAYSIYSEIKKQYSAWYCSQPTSNFYPYELLQEVE